MSDNQMLYTKRLKILSTRESVEAGALVLICVMVNDV